MAAARRYWFALAVSGALLALSLPLYLKKGFSCPPVQRGGDMVCAVGIASPEGVLGSYDLAHPGWLKVYWLLAALVGAALVGWCYRRSGKGLRVLPFLAVIVLFTGLTVAFTAGEWSGIHSPSAWAETPRLLLVFNGATPLLVLAPALLVLALAERSALLGLFALGFGGLTYVFATRDSFYVLQSLGMQLDISADPSGIRQLLNIAIPTVVLLLAAVGARLLRAPTGESNLQQEPAS